MTAFRQYQDVAAIEHDDQTRQPKEGGVVFNGCVTEVSDVYVQVVYNVGPEHSRLNGSRPDTYYAGSGWRAWDGSFRWRLVPLCRCERPVLTGDGQFCSDECRDDAAEAQSVQRYGYGVAT